MVRHLLFTGFFFFSTVNLFSQTINGSIKGQLRDTAEHQVLKRATISALHTDSSLVTQVLSGDDGSFSINNLPFSNYILKIAFSGYETRFTNFTIDNNNA